ncbi:unnamed protein product [Cuscuta epithymum]|uniref:Uncharacterized protein n=1 Tax=Cuscuta epithymum TaxID=186058 RepID=A0AAV0EW35_9ASTE|nr:unnamed protein product [Cuscuta epithymum]
MRVWKVKFNHERSYDRSRTGSTENTFSEGFDVYTTFGCETLLGILPRYSILLKEPRSGRKVSGAAGVFARKFKSRQSSNKEDKSLLASFQDEWMTTCLVTLGSKCGIT